MGAANAALLSFLFLRANSVGGACAMANLHFNEYPLNRDLFNVSEEKVENRFTGWKKSGNYTISIAVILQVDTTNVSSAEKQIAPNIIALSVNQAIINIYKIWHKSSVSFSEFQEYYALQEAALERYINELLGRLNTARHNSGLYGDWFINYSLNERHIEVREPAEAE